MFQGYTEDNTGVGISEAEQLEYNSWFADLCHANGMTVGLKNSIEIVPILVNKFDFALNEECFRWKECDVSTRPPSAKIHLYRMLF